MIGSDTFIMVAFMCSDSSTPSAFASWMADSKNSHSLLQLMTVASTTSPSSTAMASFSTRSSPLGVVSVIFSSPAVSTTADSSLE